MRSTAPRNEQGRAVPSSGSSLAFYFSSIGWFRAEHHAWREVPCQSEPTVTGTRTRRLKPQTGHPRRHGHRSQSEALLQNLVKNDFTCEEEGCRLLFELLVRRPGLGRGKKLYRSLTRGMDAVFGVLQLVSGHDTHPLVIPVLGANRGDLNHHTDLLVREVDRHRIFLGEDDRGFPGK